MQSAKKLIRLGGCPGHWRKKILNIGSGGRGWGRGRGGAGVGGRGEANRIIAGSLVGHRSFSKLLAAPHAVYPRFLHLCMITICTVEVLIFVHFPEVRAYEVCISG